MGGQERAPDREMVTAGPKLERGTPAGGDKGQAGRYGENIFRW